jgi:hypothetical protein
MVGAEADVTALLTLALPDAGADGCEVPEMGGGAARVMAANVSARPGLNQKIVNTPSAVKMTA